VIVVLKLFELVVLSSLAFLPWLTASN